MLLVEGSSYIKVRKMVDVIVGAIRVFPLKVVVLVLTSFMNL